MESVSRCRDVEMWREEIVGPPKTHASSRGPRLSGGASPNN